MEDINKNKRISMWWAFVIFLAAMPVFIYFDNRTITDDDLAAINGLILSEDAYYDPGGGKASSPSLKFQFINTKRKFQLIYQEYSCVINDTILANFKKGDTISIKIDKTDKEDFYKTSWLSKMTKLYGLSKNGKNYLSLDCRNKVSAKWTHAGIIANISVIILSLFFALFIYKPKTKYQAIGQFPVDPVLIVIITWLFIFLTLR